MKRTLRLTLLRFKCSVARRPSLEPLVFEVSVELIGEILDMTSQRYDADGAAMRACNSKYNQADVNPGHTTPMYFWPRGYTWYTRVWATVATIVFMSNSKRAERVEATRQMPFHQTPQKLLISCSTLYGCRGFQADCIVRNVGRPGGVEQRRERSSQR